MAFFSNYFHCLPSIFVVSAFLSYFCIVFSLFPFIHPFSSFLFLPLVGTLSFRLPCIVSLLFRLSILSVFPLLPLIGICRYCLFIPYLAPPFWYLLFSLSPFSFLLSLLLFLLSIPCLSPSSHRKSRSLLPFLTRSQHKMTCKWLSLNPKWKCRKLLRIL